MGGNQSNDEPSSDPNHEPNAVLRTFGRVGAAVLDAGEAHGDAVSAALDKKTAHPGDMAKEGLGIIAAGVKSSSAVTTFVGTVYTATAAVAAISTDAPTPTSKAPPSDDSRPPSSSSGNNNNNGGESAVDRGVAMGQALGQAEQHMRAAAATSVKPTSPDGPESTVSDSPPSSSNTNSDSSSATAAVAVGVASVAVAQLATSDAAKEVIASASKSVIETLVELWRGT